MRKDAWSSPSLKADRAGWLKKLRRTLRFLLPTSGEAIVLDFVRPRLIHFDAKHIELAFDVAEGGPGHLSGICHHTKSLGRAAPFVARQH
jgi:hypothetical protein